MQIQTILEPFLTGFFIQTPIITLILQIQYQLTWLPLPYTRQIQLAVKKCFNFFNCSQPDKQTCMVPIMGQMNSTGAA